MEVKGLKRYFTPQYVQTKNECGKHVPITERAQAIADYLASKHWNKDLSAGMPDDTLILLNNGAEESIFTLEE